MISFAVSFWRLVEGGVVWEGIKFRPSARASISIGERVLSDPLKMGLPLRNLWRIRLFLNIIGSYVGSSLVIK